MKKVILTLALWFCFTSSAIAAELLMFSMASCGYCQSFLKEVAPTYAETDHAKLLPLRIISMDRKAAPKWFVKAYDARKIDGIAGTPTFIVFASGEEKARLIGYQGKERFYEDIGNFIQSNLKALQASAGVNPIPYEPDTEMDYKQAQVLEQQEQPVVEEHKHEGSNSDSDKYPNGVFKSDDIRDHIYETETMAQIAANWLGCRGVHEHIINGRKIFMPCTME